MTTYLCCGLDIFLSSAPIARFFSWALSLFYCLILFMMSSVPLVGPVHELCPFYWVLFMSSAPIVGFFSWALPLLLGSFHELYPYCFFSWALPRVVWFFSWALPLLLGSFHEQVFAVRLSLPLYYYWAGYWVDCSTRDVWWLLYVYFIYTVLYNV